MEEKTIGERCKAYRRCHMMTQEAFAKLCGVHVNTVIHAEQGKPLHWMSEERIKKVVGGWEE